MKFILATTPRGTYRYISVQGKEPLRDYTQTRSLVKNRLRESYPGFADLLAVPNFLPDGSIEWTTESFNTLPRPLSSLHGTERNHYDHILSQSIRRLGKAVKDDPAANEMDSLLGAITTVLSDDVIYCADNRLAITEWGLRPVTGGKGFSLLSFADTAGEKPEPPTKSETDAHVTPEPHEEKKTPVKEPEEKKEETSGSGAVPPVITPDKTKDVMLPEPPVPVTPVPQDNKPKKKRKWWIWLLVGLAVVTLVLGIAAILNSCSTHESVATLPKTPPKITEDNIVLKDSMSYIAADRLTIMVLQGGTMDEFIKDFRKEYPDKDNYKLFAPDTTFNTVQLQLPAEELDNAKKEIPGKMAPKYRVSVIYDGIIKSNYTPSDPAMTNRSQSYYFDMVNAPEAWDIQKGDPGLIVAVLDDGFDTGHPELQGKVVDAFDVDSNTPGTKPSKSGHGQHTSGTAVGTADNNSGACGIAPSCKAMPINVFTGDVASSYNIIMGLAYAARHGAKVISISIGQYFGPGVKFLSYQDQKAIAQSYMTEEAEMFDEIYRQLDEMGITVVRAAGNETILAELDPMNRSQYPIIVSAVDPNGSIAIFDPVTLNGSNWGERCDISAPGVNIYNSIPGGYDFMSGTSMACPQVAGGVALIYSQHPDLKPQQVKEVLVKTAVPTDEHVGPLMDLAAALKADPNNLPQTPQQGTQPALPGRGDPTQPYYQDPYAFYFYNNPAPGGNPTPGMNPVPGTNPGISPTPGGNDCQQAIRELQELQRRYDEIVRRYGACL